MRRLPVLLAIVTLLLLAFPLAASAGTWSVWDRHGHKVGYERDLYFFNLHGSSLGSYDNAGEDPLNANIYRGAATRVATVIHGTIYGANGSTVIGRVAKSHGSGRWIVQKLVSGHYQLRGRVTGGAPSVGAAGAVRLLCW